MSQIKITSLAIGLLLSLLALAGCGDRNSQATFDPATLKHIHPDTWKFTHKTEALANLNSCTECHGDFTGGISKVSCSQCHLGGVDSAHPLSWGKNTPGDTDSIIIGHRNSYNPARCTTETCHAAGGTAQQKLCTSCHVWSATSKHPEDFTLATSGFTSHANYVNTNTNASCAVASCHGIDLLANTTVQSSVSAFGPSCHACHPDHL